MKRRALVLGGSGYVGGAVARELARRGVDVWCTYWRGAPPAEFASRGRALRRDLLDEADVISAVRAASAEGPLSILVHAAGRFENAALGDITKDAFAEAMDLGVHAPLVATRELVRQKPEGARADVVLLTALDRAQSLALPAHFAAAEGAKGALAMALAKALGRDDVRVNALAVGLLAGGMGGARGGALGTLAQDFEAFSALGRRGTADEVAKVVAFLVLDSDFLTGKTVAVNGGI